MNNLQVGFSRFDITPPLGAPLNGYTFVRYGEGVLDALEVNSIAFSDGTRRAIMVTYDFLGMSKEHLTRWRREISERTGVPTDAIYITASHSHTAPGSPRDGQDEIATDYFALAERHIVDSAVLAVQDLKCAKMGFGIGKAENVSFCRRYRMKDGTCRTNPGVDNPDILSSISEVDTRVSVVRFDREGAETVLIVNFANHPDTVGGNLFSADWPGAMRRTVEKVYGNVKCAFVNGAQGDINHVNVHPRGGYSNDLFMDFDDVARGYGHTQYIGRVVAAGVMQAYDKVEYVDVESISALVKTIDIPSNRPKPEELPEAEYIYQMWQEGREKELPYEGMMLTTKLADARRKVTLKDGPDSFEMDLIGLKLGDVAFLGIPGEPFSEIGNQIKRKEGYKMVIPTCLTNGYQGYFPTYDAYAEGGYEAGNSKFKAGVAESIIEGALALLGELAEKA